jgi:hypothetical protein
MSSNEIVLIILSFGAWLPVGFYARSIRSAEGLSLLEIPVRPWVKLFFAATVLPSAAVALILTLISIAPFQVPLSGDPRRFELFGMGSLLGAIAMAFGLLVYYSNLIITPAGLCVGPIGIRWHEVDAIDLRLGNVEIRTPLKKRVWNSWTGRLLLPTLIWPLTPEAVSEIRQIWQTARTEVNT